MEISPRKSHYVQLSAILPILFTGLCAGELLAQQDTATQLTSGSTTINLQVVQTRTVNVGDHLITLNQVVPPVLPPPASPPLPTPAPLLSPEMLQWIQAREEKSFQFIMLGATVYDHQITDLRWYDGGQWMQAFSNIDFGYMTGIGEFETPDTIYEFFMMTSDMSTDYLQGDSPTLTALAQAKQQLPNLLLSPQTPSSYFITVGNLTASGSSDAITALNAVHAYYDANHDKLIADYQKRMADYAAQQKYLKEHPPIPPNTVINYWPIKSSVYLKNQN